MHDQIAPICISSDYGWFRSFAVRVDMSQVQSILSGYEVMWSETYPDNIFSYDFVDDNIAKFYSNDTIDDEPGPGLRRSLRSLSAVSAYMVWFRLWRYERLKRLVSGKCWVLVCRRSYGCFAREFVILIGIAFLMAVSVCMDVHE
ncbi:MAG: hypothetical protein WDO14_16690 [Bacteroidota bacterium]